MLIICHYSAYYGLPSHLAEWASWLWTLHALYWYVDNSNVMKDLYAYQKKSPWHLFFFLLLLVVVCFFFYGPLSGILLEWRDASLLRKKMLGLRATAALDISINSFLLETPSTEAHAWLSSLMSLGCMHRNTHITDKKNKKMDTRQLATSYTRQKQCCHTKLEKVTKFIYRLLYFESN